MVYNLALHYLHNAEDAEEVTQDVFLKVYKSLSKFEGRSSAKTWIYRITINQCLDRLKAQKRKKRFGFLQSIGAGEDEVDLPTPQFDHPGVQLEQQEAVAHIMQQIHALPENQKTALILKSIEGLPVAEIADIMGLSRKAVESLLARARKNLEKKLGKDKGLESKERLTK